MNRAFDDEEYEDAMLAIAKLRTDANYSPHGAIGERPRAPPRPASVHDALLGASLALDDWRPATVAPLVRDLPTPPLSIDEDPAFKNDLAHVLVWFEEDLSAPQRLSAAYTLARHLTSWQQDVLIKCLTHDEHALACSAGESPSSPFGSVVAKTSSPSSWISKVATPEPQRPPGFNWSPPPSTAKSTSPEEQFQPANPDLFYSDLPNWLRLHRLHKYEANLLAIKRDTLLHLDDEALEQLDVKALGARRKFLRLFDSIIKLQTS